jgi:hypothetical protein
VRELPKDVVDEYLTLALLMPLLGTDIRAESLSTIYCSDASLARDRGCVGVCSTEVTPEIAAELYRNRVRPGHKGFRELFDLPIDLVDELGGLPDDWMIEGADPRWFGSVADALGWNYVASYDTGSRRHHITRFELAAARTAVRAAIFSRKNGRSFRMINGIDSDPVVYALAKGRSSRKLNVILRRLAAEQLLAGVYLGVLRIPTHQNPADAPSRRARVRRSPVCESAKWASAFVTGDLAALQKGPGVQRKRVGHKWLAELPVGNSELAFPPTLLATGPPDEP